MPAEVHRQAIGRLTAKMKAAVGKAPTTLMILEMNLDMDSQMVASMGQGHNLQLAVLEPCSHGLVRAALLVRFLVPYRAV